MVRVFKSPLDVSRFTIGVIGKVIFFERVLDELLGEGTGGGRELFLKVASDSPLYG